MKKGTQIQVMHNVWDNLVNETRKPTDMPSLNFDEIISSVFASGPFYFYVIDFFDMGISHISNGFKAAHGIDPENIKTINEILALVHPEDMDHVARCEKKAFDIIYSNLGVDKITRYKISYNFRFKTANGTYKLYNHQSLILTVDEKGNFIKSLNIHTDISHITKRNNYRFSLIGLAGEPSWLDLDPQGNGFENKNTANQNIYSKREIEILKLIAEGLENTEIGDKLFISINTVKTHRKAILKKSGCKNTAELIAKCIGEGWI